ncbi:hypothetical protein M409DRAFT_55441 [Zasmidium cellare ATCC 36951]|uniref:Uncharacterized protein n=1 Tax=Zasmidium cellare ATCC 36951 TaxID=1080233 RepID=A0A6A6CK62_ZASCE|nr:uncharacterized protein M409DRAFT_55441 [Zasmidium cellare ATCC 36951]KAF2166099.1 hypothetical protein M409DRAFT_55441 [Zasmidium cellare ATCC 36951]
MNTSPSTKPASSTSNSANPGESSNSGSSATTPASGSVTGASGRQTTTIATTSFTLVTSILTGTTLITIPTQEPTSSSELAAAEAADEEALPPLAVTGIGIGAGIGGGLALIALGVLFYLYRRRRHRMQQPTPRWAESDRAGDILSVSTEMAPIPSSLPERKASTIGRQTTTTSTGIELLPPLPDHQLASLLVPLISNIKTHVEMFYITDVVPASPKPSHVDSGFMKLTEVLDEGAPLDANAMDALLREPRTRFAAIRMLIAWSILRNIEVSAPLDRTLLPPELVRVIGSMETGQYQQSDDLSLTHSQTRHTTASLLSPIYSTTSTSSSPELDVHDPRRPNIVNLTNDLAPILQPYVKPKLGRQRSKDLEMLINLGAQIGYTLFSQPTTWRFDWGGERHGADEIVVFPAFVKVGDEGGQRLRREVVISGAEMMTLGVGR